MRRSGPGGLDEGSIEASTIYYLYSIWHINRIWLLASKKPPEFGPNFSADWTYIGAFVTSSGSVLKPFISSNGIFRSTYALQSVSETNNTSPQSRTVLVPETAKFHFGSIDVRGSAVDVNGTVNGENDSSGTGLTQTVANTTSQRNYAFGSFPVLDGTTVYLWVSAGTATVRYKPYGWLEDPGEWK